MLNPQAQKQIDDQTVKKYSAHDGLKDSIAKNSITEKAFLFPHTSVLLIIGNCKLKALCMLYIMNLTNCYIINGFFEK